MADLLSGNDELEPVDHDLSPQYDVGMSQPGPVMFMTRVVDFSKAVAEARKRGLWAHDQHTRDRVSTFFSRTDSPKQSLWVGPDCTGTSQHDWRFESPDH